VLYTGTGGAMQVSYCADHGAHLLEQLRHVARIVGTDSAWIVTMGSSGVPASGWVVTFNGTWPAAPACVVQSALSTMVVGKMPIAVQTSTTTITVTTNGTAPATSDKYASTARSFLMKTIAAYLAGFVTALALAAGAAVTTITTTAPEDARSSPRSGST
jgi:hypothetical protein